MTTAITSVIKPHTKDLGGFGVRRLLPAFPTRMVGPFIFFDHMGPADFAPGSGIDVRPHPHIGLATVTYLFEGALMHRDSLGMVQRITPGDVNWMTAGRGIVHSERSPPEERAAGSRLHGLQSWIVLPAKYEGCTPAFSHHPKDTLPVITADGATLTLIAGSAFGRRAPAQTFSEMFYLAVEMAPGARCKLPEEYAERAIYPVDGEVKVAGSPLAPQHMALAAAGAAIEITAVTAARVMLLGGAKLDGEHFIWWNFVASKKALIEDAKARWQAQSFAPVPGETEFIPLPER
jgi:redox-sensitive bicupin YhaK (pirin superfamily)